MVDIKENKCVTLLSGGLDSTTMLYFLKSRGFEQKAISFDYGQKHKKELEFARYHAKFLEISHSVINLGALNEVFSNSALTDAGVEIPEGYYTDENQKITVVPNRNMIFLSIGVALAENNKYNSVMYAGHLGDSAVYPDCRPQFVHSLDEASQLGTYNHIRVIEPFESISKNEIAALGFSFDMDFTKTWSCYRGEKEPCGKCGSCRERAEAISYVRYLMEIGCLFEKTAEIERKIDLHLEEMLI